MYLSDTMSKLPDSATNDIRDLMDVDVERRGVPFTLYKKKKRMDTRYIKKKPLSNRFTSLSHYMKNSRDVKREMGNISTDCTHNSKG